jgi:hypothetical protein
VRRDRPHLSRLPAVVAAAGLLAATAGCQRDDSVLLVEVAGDVTLALSQLAVTVTAGTTARGFLIPPSPTEFSFPTSFTVELDRSITGPVTIAIDAFDGNGYIVGSGSTTQTYINAGGQTIMTVTIDSGTPP